MYFALNELITRIISRNDELGSGRKNVVYLDVDMRKRDLTSYISDEKSYRQ